MNGSNRRGTMGLGDLVAPATRAVGVKPCRSCEKRRAALNEWSAKYARYVPERLRERLGLRTTGNG